MKQTTAAILDDLVKRYGGLSVCKDDIYKAFLVIEKAYKNGKKLLVCGNGGSAADAEHVVGELMKRFKKRRDIKPDVYRELCGYGDRGKLLQGVLEGSLRAIALTQHVALSTAFANDKCPAAVFAQQVYGLADGGDVLLAFSTSGNSENCVLAAVTAKAMGVTAVALTGADGGELSAVCDITVKAPETETYKVQELHLPIYHALCAMLEEELF